MIAQPDLRKTAAALQLEAQAQQQRALLPHIQTDLAGRTPFWQRVEFGDSRDQKVARALRDVAATKPPLD